MVEYCRMTDELSDVLGAVAHPARRAILARLAGGPARVTEIAEPFDLSLNAVSKHLKVLEEAGLIEREKVGREHILRFRGKPLRQVSIWVHAYERFWSERLDQFEEFFKQKRRRS
jgi:DNA-binding transcriptional ArsR family regulator